MSLHIVHVVVLELSAHVTFPSYSVYRVVPHMIIHHFNSAFTRSLALCDHKHWVNWVFTLKLCPVSQPELVYQSWLKTSISNSHCQQSQRFLFLCPSKSLHVIRFGLCKPIVVRLWTHHAIWFRSTSKLVWYTM